MQLPVCPEPVLGTASLLASMAAGAAGSPVESLVENETDSADMTMPPSAPWMSELRAWFVDALPKVHNADTWAIFRAFAAAVTNLRDGQSFSMKIPVWWINIFEMSISRVECSKGAAVSFIDACFSLEKNPYMTFPPSGHSLEVAVYSNEFVAENLGSLTRTNLDAITMAQTVAD